MIKDKLIRCYREGSEVVRVTTEEFDILKEIDSRKRWTKLQEIRAQAESARRFKGLLSWIPR